MNFIWHGNAAFFCEQFAEKYVSNGNINIFSCSNDVYWNSPLHSFQYELIPEKNWICILNCEIVGSSWKVKDLARINGPKANSIQISEPLKKCGESCKYKTKCNWNCWMWYKFNHWSALRFCEVNYNISGFIALLTYWSEVPLDWAERNTTLRKCPFHVELWLDYEHMSLDVSSEIPCYEWGLSIGN